MGDGHFLRFYLISTLATAWSRHGSTRRSSARSSSTSRCSSSTPLLIATRPFLLSTILPIRVTFLAWLALAALLTGVFFGSKANIAALAGAAVGFGYYISQRVRVWRSPRLELAAAAEVESDDRAVIAATRNVTRVAAVKKALQTGSVTDIDRLIELAEREIVSGVNICPPADFKPEHSDRYCVRCEGFAECTARHLRLNRPNAPVSAPASASIEQAGAVT